MLLCALLFRSPINLLLRWLYSSLSRSLSPLPIPAHYKKIFLTQLNPFPRPLRVTHEDEHWFYSMPKGNVMIQFDMGLVVHAWQ